MGYKWTHKAPIKLTFNDWDRYKEDSCISFDSDGIQYSPISFYEKYSWNFKNIQTADKFVEINKHILSRSK